MSSSKHFLHLRRRLFSHQLMLMSFVLPEGAGRGPKHSTQILVRVLNVCVRGEEWMWSTCSTSDLAIDERASGPHCVHGCSPRELYAYAVAQCVRSGSRHVPLWTSPTASCADKPSVAQQIGPGHCIAAWLQPAERKSLVSIRFGLCSMCPLNICSKHGLFLSERVQLDACRAGEAN